MSFNEIAIPAAIIVTYLAMESVMLVRGDTDISPLAWVLKRIHQFKHKANKQ